MPFCGPILFTIVTRVDAHCDSKLIGKFAGDTAVMGLITNGDESANRQAVDGLGLWCWENNLTLNNKKTKAMIVDFRKNSTAAPPPLLINGTAVEVVPSIKYIGVHFSNTLTWRENTMSLVKKGSSAPVFSEEVEGGGAEPKHPQLPLQICGGECTDLVHHSLVLQLHRGREEGTAEGGKVCKKDHRIQLFTPLKHLQQPMH